MASDHTPPNAEQAATAFSAAMRTEPKLQEALRLADAQGAGDLPSIEAWLSRFNVVMAENPNLANFRRLIFSHLLRTHNAAVERAAALARAQGAKR